MQLAVAAMIAGLAALAPATARADAIDGAWCLEKHGRLTIDGPAIVTPGGAAIRGDYSRHYFRYTVPPGEAGAGATMEMRLLNEETMQMRQGPGAEVETWHRCSPNVSDRGAPAPART